MNEELLKQLVWMDYRLAFVIGAIAPLILLIWAVTKKKEAIYKLLIIYWRVASLMLIAIYLLVPGWEAGFLSGIGVRILIPLTLWFWVDLNEEIRDYLPSLLKFVFAAWRWAATIYFTLSAIASFYFIPCGLSGSSANSFCTIWQEVPWAYRASIHSEPGNAGILGFFGAMGLCFYLLYFVYFLLVRLGKQGRSALEQ